MATTKPKKKRTLFQVGDIVKITEHGSNHLKGIRRTEREGRYQKEYVRAGQLAKIVRVRRKLIGGVEYDIRLLKRRGTRFMGMDYIITGVPSRTGFGYPFMVKREK